MEYYTYLLINPLTDLPFYVGKGKGDRAWTHLNYYDPHNHHKSGTVKKIQKCGLDPIICIVKKDISDLEAKTFETKLIEHYGKSTNGGILTNIADGGQGGYTGPVSKATSKKLSAANSGIKNANAKLTESDVINIYKSCETISDLGRLFNIGSAEIRKIKHRQTWKSVISKIKNKPGYHYNNRKEFLSKEEFNQEVIDVFQDDRTVSNIKNDSVFGVIKIKQIKNREIYTEITNNLEFPDIIYYGLTNKNRIEIKNSSKSLKELSLQYNVHLETIRNIKMNYYR